MSGGLYPMAAPAGRLARYALLASLALLAVVAAENAFAQEEVYDVEEVKAAFLYHFSAFVLWPDSAPEGDAFTIAVLGAPEVAAELRRYLPGRSLHGRPMQVRELGSIDQLDGEAVLYIGPSRNDRLEELLGEVIGRPLLVVTDARGALRMGSMINFRLVDRRVRFEISLPAAERAGLELSSRLLSAALFVDTTSAILPPPGGVLVAARGTRLF